jgi:hypothetical protein
MGYFDANRRENKYQLRAFEVTGPQQKGGMPKSALTSGEK